MYQIMQPQPRHRTLCTTHRTRLFHHLLLHSLRLASARRACCGDECDHSKRTPQSWLITSTTEATLPRTLLVLMGQLRGGIEAWQSMEQHLRRPFAADLALLIHDSLVRREPWRAQFLLSRANHTWWVDDPCDAVRKRATTRSVARRAWWTCGWDGVVTRLMGSASWRSNVTLYGNLWGGVTDHNGNRLQGSGAISLTLRELLVRKLDALRGYEQVIVTRSDHFHMCSHPRVVATRSPDPSSGGRAFVPWGGDAHGVTDRHMIFAYESRRVALGLLPWLVAGGCNQRRRDQQEGGAEAKAKAKQQRKCFSPETALGSYLVDRQVTACRYPRTFVTVARLGERSTFGKTRAGAMYPLPVRLRDRNGSALWCKYETEYMSASKSCTILDGRRWPGLCPRPDDGYWVQRNNESAARGNKWVALVGMGEMPNRVVVTAGTEGEARLARFEHLVASGLLPNVTLDPADNPFRTRSQWPARRRHRAYAVRLLADLRGVKKLPKGVLRLR